jgi:hypothetical protein
LQIGSQHKVVQILCGVMRDTSPHVGQKGQILSIFSDLGYYSS